MVFGRVVRQSSGSIIKIRAGSDLNLVIPMFVVCGLLVVSYLYDWIAGSPLSTEDQLIPWVGGIMVVTLFFAHVFRSEADHMVQFLIDILSPTQIEGFGR